MNRHKLGIIGLGFVGTACEIGFSSMPNTDVWVHDKYKPTDSLAHVLHRARILFICLPTPMNFDGSCDTSIVEEVVDQIARFNLNRTIVIKSTVPPGTTQKLADKYPHLCLVFNPEFLTEDNFITDFADQKLVVLGYTKNDSEFNRRALQHMNKFYLDFANHQKRVTAEIKWTNSNTAEMFKYATNCFLATKVSFLNEIKQIAEATDANYNDLKELLKLDPRLGTSHFMVPGPDGKHGFGKSCFPKDINALIYTATENDVDTLVLEAVWSKNLLVREDYDWEDLAQVNGDYKSKQEAV